MRCRQPEETVKSSKVCAKSPFYFTEILHFILEKNDYANPWNDNGSDDVWSVVETGLG